MVEPIQTYEERGLADRLQAEAKATRPAFSDALHDRICQSLKPQATPPARRASGRRSVHARLSAAVVATLLVGAGLVASWLGKSPGPGLPPDAGGIASIDLQETAADPDMITAPTGEVAERLALMVDEALTTSQWAYLDHDARVAVRLLLDQLPFDAESTENL